MSDININLFFFMFIYKRKTKNNLLINSYIIKAYKQNKKIS